MILSIIIVNYKSENYLKNCIDSLQRKLNDKIPYELILVNNDPQIDLNATEDFSSYKIITPKGNKGFGAANNLGAKSAKGKYLFFLNPDTKVLFDDIQEIINEFEADEHLGMIGAQLITPEWRNQEWSAGHVVNLRKIIANNLGIVRDKKIWESEKKIHADWVSGAACLVRKDLFQELGGFDEDFFMYFEDVDFCKRVCNHGKKILFHPELKVLHYGGGSHENNNKLQKENYYKSQDYYFKKHCSEVEAKLLKILRRLQS